MNVMFNSNFHRELLCWSRVANKVLLGESVDAQSPLSSFAKRPLPVALDGLCRHNIWHNLGISAKNYAPE